MKKNTQYIPSKMNYYLSKDIVWQVWLVCVKYYNYYRQKNIYFDFMGDEAKHPTFENSELQDSEPYRNEDKELKV